MRSLRKRQLIAAYKAEARAGTYWGIRGNIADYDLPDTLLCPHDKTLEIAAIPTRLKGMPAETQERLINWGYAICDTAMRKHVETSAARGTFPYPGGVG